MPVTMVLPLVLWDPMVPTALFVNESLSLVRTEIEIRKKPKIDRFVAGNNILGPSRGVRPVGKRFRWDGLTDLRHSLVFLPFLLVEEWLSTEDRRCWLQLHCMYLGVD